MRKRIVAMLLVINMLASIMLCINGGNGFDKLYAANAADIDTAAYSVGGTIKFGSYEQDNNKSNGAEPIEWIVLSKSDGQLLLLSKYVLFRHQYHIDYQDDTPACPWKTTWEKCKVRTYLNDSFYNTAFSDDEKKHISISYLENKKNPDYGTAGGNKTYDRVFLLSHAEVNSYVKGKSWAKATPTKYAKANGVSTNSSGYCHWWMRSPGLHSGNAAYVFTSGNIDSYGNDVGHRLGIRPVIRIQQDAIKATESVKLNAESMTVKATDSVALTAAITPSDSGFPTFWSSSNTNVAKVDSNGKVTIVGLGKVTITAKSGSCSDSCELSVIPGYTLKAVGGSVRVTDPYGLRFGIQLMKDAAYNKSSKSIVSYGTLIIPKKTLGDAELTLSTPSVMQIKASNIYSSDSKQLTYTGVLVGIPNSSFDDEIVGRGYLTYKDADGTKHTIYTDAIVRTYRQVADSAFQRYAAMTKRTKTEQTVYERLQSIINTINDTENDNVVSSADCVSLDEVVAATDSSNADAVSANVAGAVTSSADVSE